MPTCGTLFSGGGLADAGLRAAGYTPVLAVEFSEAIAEAYGLNFGARHLHVADVADVCYRAYAGLDLLWVSPPCPNFSVAKTGKGETAADVAMAEATARAVREIAPTRFVLENVPAYRESASFALILAELARGGYAVEWSLRMAADYGVPQSRRRLILRAVREARSVPPLLPTHCRRGGLQSGLFGEAPLAPWNGWYAAIEDLLPGLPDSQLADWQLKRLPEVLDRHFGSALLVTDQERQYADADEPAIVVRALSGGGAPPKALLIDGDGNRSRDPSTFDAANPSMTVQAWHGRRPTQRPSAILIDSQQTVFAEDREGRRFATAAPDQPAHMVPAHVAKGQPKALLVQGTSTLEPRAAEGSSAAVMATVGAKGIRPAALLENATVKRVDARCLARFQSVPDGFQLPEGALAFRIVGNGVPCLWAQRIGESL